MIPPSQSSMDGMLSPAMGVYSATLDRPYRPTGVGDYPTATVPRNYHYGPVGGYEDYRPGPPSEAYTSLSRGSHMDERYRYRNTSNSEEVQTQNFNVLLHVLHLLQKLHFFFLEQSMLCRNLSFKMNAKHWWALIKALHASADLFLRCILF